MLASYAKSLAYVSLRTVPLILVGIWASMWIMSRLPLTGAVTGAPVVSIVIIALFAVLLTLPSLFEILWLCRYWPSAAQRELRQPCCLLRQRSTFHRFSSLADTAWKVDVALALLAWVIAAVGGLLLG